MPAGLLVTVPGPDTVTFSACGDAWLKEAVTPVAAETVTVHVVVAPVHTPPHPPNIEPVPGVSVSVTTAFCAKVAEQVPGQLMPAGLLVTVPEPDRVTTIWGVEA